MTTSATLVHKYIRLYTLPFVFALYPSPSHHIIQVDDNFNEFVRDRRDATPLIIESGSMYFVVVEKEMYEVDSFFEALCALIGLYYVFDIEYPRTCLGTLLFLEKFIFKISSGPELPKSIVGIVSDILNVTV